MGEWDVCLHAHWVPRPSQKVPSNSTPITRLGSCTPAPETRVMAASCLVAGQSESRGVRRRTPRRMASAQTGRLAAATIAHYEDAYAQMGKVGICLPAQKV